MSLAGVRKLDGHREMEEDATESSVTTPKVHNDDWSKTLEKVEEYLPTFRGMNGAPLSYVVRKQLVPTSEADYLLNGYDNIDEEMIERAPILVAGIVGNTAALEANGPFTASYLTDQDTVWAKLTAIVVYSTAWTYHKVGKVQHIDMKGYLPCVITTLDQIILITWHLRPRRLFKTQYTMGNESKITLKVMLRYRRISIPFW